MDLYDDIPHKFLYMNNHQGKQVLIWILHHSSIDGVNGMSVVGLNARNYTAKPVKMPPLIV